MSWFKKLFNLGTPSVVVDSPAQGEYPTAVYKGRRVPYYTFLQLCDIQKTCANQRQEISGKIQEEYFVVKSQVLGTSHTSTVPLMNKVSYHCHYPDTGGSVCVTVQDIPSSEDVYLLGKYSNILSDCLIHLLMTQHCFYIMEVTKVFTDSELQHLQRVLNEIYRQTLSHAMSQFRLTNLVFQLNQFPGLKITLYHRNKVNKNSILSF